MQKGSCATLCCFIAFLLGAGMTELKENNTKETLFQPPWIVILDQYKVSLETANKSPKTIG